MKRIAGLVLATGLTQAAHAACGAALGPGALVAASPRYEVAFRPDPAIAVATHFALDLVVCPRAGAALPTSVTVDAWMPAHRHGMNYRPSVAATGTGRWRAEGLMLHLPGEWELRFDFARGEARERALWRKELP